MVVVGHEGTAKIGLIIYFKICSELGRKQLIVLMNAAFLSLTRVFFQKTKLF